MTDPRQIRAQVPPPVDLHDGFEAGFQAAQSLFLAGQADQARAVVARLREGLDRIGPDLAGRRAARLDALDPMATTLPQPGPGTLPPGLDAEAPVLPGVSVVTAARNRTDNLMQALRSWLAAPEVREVVIVDWSSDQPVAESLAAAGLTDPRIRVARVEGEPAWVLTWAFNLGFRLARHDRVLKADADIRLAPGFFAANPLCPGQVVTGNWRTARPGQEYINGVFYIHRADLAAVQGFNEHITRYGWDDDDLYDRLIRAGVDRADLAAGTVDHIDHDDTARLSPVPEALATGWTDLRALPMYGIRTNRLIATLMPDWTPARRMQPFAETPDGILRRKGPLPHPVPAPMQRSAERLAGREMLSWQAGPRVFELEDEALDLLLTARRLAGTTALHVALMLAQAPLDAVVADRHLVADLDLAALQARPETAERLKQSLRDAAQVTGRCLVLRGHEAPGVAFGGLFADLAHLPAQTALGPAPEVDLHGAGADALSPVLRLTAGLDLLRGLTPGPATGAPRDPLLLAPNTAFPATGDPARTATPRHHPAPSVIPGGPGRLFLDAQHGLGNRLRAIGSAAAVARATGRELVVIWEPDAHCEARMSDLFAYSGPLLEQSAAPPGTTRISYMELEEGAAKDAPLTLTDGQDAYIRSAYVLNHPASHWGVEAAFLRALQPSPQVLALVRGHTRDRPRPEIGLHIRMQGAPGTDLASYDSAENWTADSHAAIRHWRGQSHHDRFIARTRALFAAMPGAQAFLAADTPQSYAALTRAFGDRITRLDRPVFDRSAAQLQYALADVLLLARARHFLGSPWSSFSELVLRLSTTIGAKETAGVDF